jgi:hypothetical protein
LAVKSGDFAGGFITCHPENYSQLPLKKRIIQGSLESSDLSAQMKIILTLTFFVMALAATTQARLTWTLQQCQDFYGTENQAAITEITGVEHFWTKNDITVMCLFKNGVDTVATVAYFRAKKFNLPEIKQLLASNAGSATWDFTPTKLTNKYIKNGDYYTGKVGDDITVSATAFKIQDKQLYALEVDTMDSLQDTLKNPPQPTLDGV